MNPGELKHRIALYRPAKPQVNAGGFRIDTGGTWELVAYAYAHVRDTSGREFYEAFTAQALGVITVRIRHYDGLDSSWSLIFEGRRYRILHVNHRDYGGRYMILKAQAIDPEVVQGGF